MPPISRPNFFTNQFLKAQDLLDEQAYHREMRWRLNRTLYTAPGVAPGGMAVASAPGNTGLTVGAGLAVDGNGREIVITDPLHVPLGANAVASAVLTLAVQYGEVNDPPGSDPASGTARFVLTPVAAFFTATNPMPQDGLHVPLAKITLDGNGRVATNGVDPSVRPNLGPNLPARGVPLSALKARVFEADSVVAIPASPATSRIDVIPPVPQGTSVFCLVDVYPTTAGGSLSWQWDISTKPDGPGGTNQSHRSVVVTNTSPNALAISYHYRIVLINDV